MLNYLFRRTLYGVLILIGVNLATFFLFFTVNTPDDMARLNIGGKRVTQEQIDKYSTDKAVTPQTPPVFLLSTSDDFVDCRNSLNFAAACKANKVPVSLHLFESGGHGYGLHGKGDLEKWPDLLECWLKTKVF